MILFTQSDRCFLFCFSLFVLIKKKPKLSIKYTCAQILSTCQLCLCLMLLHTIHTEKELSVHFCNFSLQHWDLACLVSFFFFFGFFIFWRLGFCLLKIEPLFSFPFIFKLKTDFFFHAMYSDYSFLSPYFSQFLPTFPSRATPCLAVLRKQTGI